MKTFLAAFRFLTIIPLPGAKEPEPEILGKSTAFFPLVGLFIGSLLVGIYYLTSQVWPPIVVSIIVLIAWVILTGAMHLEGFMDTCDGFFSHQSKEKILQIMRDPHLGAIGALMGFCLLLAKIAFLLAITQSLKLPALFLSPVFGRFAITGAIYFYPYGRKEGLGKPFEEHCGILQFMVATIFTLIITFSFLRLLAIILLLATWLINMAISQHFSRRLNGLTGDLYGALCELNEVSALFLFALLRRGFVPPT